MFLLSGVVAFMIAVLLARAFSKPSAAHSKRVTVITGNQRKVEDASSVFGVQLPLVTDNVEEVQDDAKTVAIKKAMELFKIFGPCMCEDTSLGPSSHPWEAKGKKHVFPALIKQLIDACKMGGGSLVNALNAISPPSDPCGLAVCVYYYTSTVAFCGGPRVVLFQCIMTGVIRNGEGQGDIDPHFVPFHYTLMQIENGQSVTLAKDVHVNNIDKKTIGEQPENRSSVHPRYFALTAAKTFLNAEGYTINGVDSVSS